MNDRYQHLLRKALDAKRSGHAAWSVQSTGERVAVALVLNRADWLAEIDYSIPEAIERTGTEWVAIIPQVARQLAEGGVTDMQILPLHRLYQVSGVLAGLLLALLLIGTATGRSTLAWIYLRSTETMTNATHIRAFPLDRLDPTCPDCM